MMENKMCHTRGVVSMRCIVRVEMSNQGGDPAIKNILTVDTRLKRYKKTVLKTPDTVRLQERM